MKKQRKTRTLKITRIVAGLLIVAALAGCGGGGDGGSSSNQDQDSNWGTLVWDQGNWR